MTGDCTACGSWGLVTVPRSRQGQGRGGKCGCQPGRGPTTHTKAPSTGQSGPTWRRLVPQRRQQDTAARPGAAEAAWAPPGLARCCVRLRPCTLSSCLGQHRASERRSNLPRATQLSSCGSRTTRFSCHLVPPQSPGSPHRGLGGRGGHSAAFVTVGGSRSSRLHPLLNCLHSGTSENPVSLEDRVSQMKELQWGVSPGPEGRAGGWGGLP